MRGEIIAIGDELTVGRVLNTTSSQAAARLFAAGHDVIAMTTVGDDQDLIGLTLKNALSRSQFVVVTGGLGPTTDDLTNEAVSTALNRPTALNHDLLKTISRQYVEGASNKKNHGPLPALDMLERLAWLPSGAQVLKPKAGMAGHLLEHEGVPLFFLPGVPHEMAELLDDCVIPNLAARDTKKPAHVRQELYRVFGLSETAINQRCCRLAKEFPDLRLGYYPVFPEVHVSLFITAADESKVDTMFHAADKAVRDSLGKHVYDTGQHPMAETVGGLLKKQGLTLAVAESCTGGRLAGLLTDVAGSSDFFLGGVVAYANSVKENLLEVTPKILSQHGAVSARTAQAMVTGVKEKTGADIAVSITGIAGPSGGSPDKPVGTVYFGLATPTGVEDYLYNFQGKRWQIQAMASQKALDLVRLHLIDTKGNSNCLGK